LVNQNGKALVSEVSTTILEVRGGVGGGGEQWYKKYLQSMLIFANSIDPSESGICSKIHSGSMLCCIFKICKSTADFGEVQPCRNVTILTCDFYG